jgi:hypothetical protein
MSRYSDWRIEYEMESQEGSARLNVISSEGGSLGKECYRECEVEKYGCLW